MQTNTAAFTAPTFAQNSAVSWPTDPFKPNNPSSTTVRSDRPRLIAPSYKWAVLPSLIAQDAYLAGWNASIFSNATAYKALGPVKYHMDGGSGILDNSREIKMRVKAYCYVYRMTNDTQWREAAWSELQVTQFNWIDSLISLFKTLRTQSATTLARTIIPSGTQDISLMSQK